MEDKFDNEEHNEEKGHMRWYDKDPVLKEALELLRLSAPDERKEAQDYILKLQEEVAADVIERIYEMVTQYAGKGNRWYDHDPTLSLTIELLRVVPRDIQRQAANNFIQILQAHGVNVEKAE